jgi:phage terminase small subunit
MSRTRKLTDQQKLFIAKYNEHLNATEAAREAGYANPGPRGCKLLKDRRIASLIAETVAAKIEKAGLSAERVLEEIRRLAFFDIRRLYDASGKLKAIKDLSDDEAAALVSIDIVHEHANGCDDHLETVIRVRLHDKIRALDMLAKHFALLKKHGARMYAGVILDEYMVARLTDEQLSQLHAAATLLRTGSTVG